MNEEDVRGFQRLSTAKTEYRLPERSTNFSAGYDFFAPYKVTCKPHEITFIRTGVKAYMMEDEVLLIFNRSSNPIKKGLILVNGVGVVDRDFFNNKNDEGEIGFMFYNMKNEDVVIERGDKLGQGMFTTFFKTSADMGKEFDATKQRQGGFGSTGK